MSKKRKPNNRKRNTPLRQASADSPAPRPALVIVADPNDSAPTLLQPPVPRKVLELCPGPDNSLSNVEVPSELVACDERSDAEATRAMDRVRDTEPAPDNEPTLDEPTLDAERTLPRDTLIDTEPLRDTEPTLDRDPTLIEEESLQVEASPSNQKSGAFERSSSDIERTMDGLPWPPTGRKTAMRWVAGAILTAATILLISGGVKAAGDYRAKVSLPEGPRAVAATMASQLTRPLPPGLAGPAARYR